MFASTVVLLALGLRTPAAQAATCDDWGQLSPSEKVVYVGETATFYILKGTDRSCGDSASCVWSVDNDQGSLSATSGSTVDWTAPDALEDCLPIDLRIYAECPGVATGSSTITLRCTDADLSALKASRGSTVAGGGCGTPSSGAPLLLLPLLLRRRRLPRGEAGPSAR